MTRSSGACAAVWGRRIGPGSLVLVSGPSGAGKDSLLDRVRGLNAGDPRIAFPRRIVTRPVSRFEDHDSATAEEFDRILENDGLAFWWTAHGLRYGLPASVDEMIGAGRCVVCNVSRTVITPLRERYENVVAVLITAPHDILAARLAARGRSSDGELQHRMTRTIAQTPDFDAVIENSGTIEDGAAKLQRAIHRQLNSACRVPSG